jgi:hypothetical protein
MGLLNWESETGNRQQTPHEDYYIESTVDLIVACYVSWDLATTLTNTVIERELVMAKASCCMNFTQHEQ